MRLHVRELAAEQPGDTLDRDPLDDIDILAAAVIALAGKSFGIFVGQHRALRFQNRARDDVLGSNQLDLVTLTPSSSLIASSISGSTASKAAEKRVSISLARLGLVADIRNLLAPRAAGADKRPRSGVGRQYHIGPTRQALGCGGFSSPISGIGRPVQKETPA